MSGASFPPSLLTLLPEIYRRLDADAQGGLAELGDVLDGARNLVAQDIARLYDDWFVETCRPERLPELAALVGWSAIPSGLASPREAVANRTAFGRAKGTVAAACEWLQAIGGWPVSIDQPDEGGVQITVQQQAVQRLRFAAPSPAAQGECGQVGAYRFHPLGIDSPLLCDGAPISLSQDEALDHAIEIHWQGEDGTWWRVARQALALADLRHWDRPWNHRAAVLIDPQRGRLLVMDPAIRKARVLVWAALPAPLPLDGDPAPNNPTELPAAEPDEWIAHVHSAIDSKAAADPAAPAPAVHYFGDLASALAAFKTQGRSGRIRILDSAAHRLNRAPISDRPAVCLAQPNAPLRLVIEARAGETPVLRGALRVHGGAAGLELELRGLAIDGVLALSGRVAARCHGCQIHAIGAMRRDERRVPAIRLSRPRHRAAPHLELHHCAVGPITARSGSIAARETVIDGYSDPLEEAIPAALSGSVRLDLVRSTVLGAIVCERLEARDCVLPYPIEIAVGRGSRIANCLVPAIGVIEGEALCLIDLENPQALFASTEFGQPGYAAIARRHAAQIHAAASDGGAIGASSSRDQARREALLEGALAEVLPLGVTGRIVWGESC